MEAIGNCFLCGSPSTVERGFLPAENIEYVFCTNEKCPLCPIGKDAVWITKAEWKATRAGRIPGNEEGK